MTTKNTILVTVAIIFAMIVAGFILLFLFVNPSARNASDRAAMLGQGLAMVGLIPIFIIWMKWAVRFRKERDEKLKSRSKGK